jgi:hypothetical protein
MKKIEGRTNISIMTGGYRNVSTSPPVNSTEATDSVSEMNAYYPNGQVQNWHTPAASTAHENHHNSEWQCSADHYWPQAETALELKNVAYGSYADETAAINAMKTGTSGATALVDSFKTVSKTYWNSLADNASSRPYAVGQLVLNGQITTVIALATTNSWASPGSVANASPTTTPVCYAAFAAWTP